MKKIFMSQWLKALLSVAYLLAIIVLTAMLGFGFPNTYKLYVNLFFIVILCLGIVRTLSALIYKSKKPERRIIIFDLLSIMVVLWCIFLQLTQYSLYEVSRYLQLAIVIKLVREIAVPQFNIRNSVISPPQLFITSFVSLILAGAGLLMLPNATVVPLSFVDALFTSTSAVCVTGLTVVDTASAFTPFGQALLLVLIQAGGLGILTFAGYIAYFFKGNSSYESQIALGTIANNDSFSEVFEFVKRIILLTFSIEFIGAVLIFFSLEDAKFSADHIFFSIFHSVSAFCNAGFSTVPHGMMNSQLVFNYSLQTVLVILIFLGGIGFPILINLLKYIAYLLRRLFLQFVHKIPNRRSWVFTLSSKVNLVTTIIILGVSSLILFFQEYYYTLSPHQGAGKVISAVFLAMTPRTAGFNHIDFSQLHFSSTLLIMLLMWIGASPAGTGGGIKTSTFAIAVINFLNIARGKDRIELYKREISPLNLQKAFAVITLSFLVIGTGVFLMTKFDSDLHLIDIAFEAFSAYSTVGLSRNITPLLSDESKGVVIVMMFIGRVSMITVLMAFFKKSTSSTYRYPTDDVLI